MCKKTILGLIVAIGLSSAPIHADNTKLIGAAISTMLGLTGIAALMRYLGYSPAAYLTAILEIQHNNAMSYLDRHEQLFQQSKEHQDRAFQMLQKDEELLNRKEKLFEKQKAFYEQQAHKST